MSVNRVSDERAASISIAYQLSIAAEAGAARSDRETAAEGVSDGVIITPATDTRHGKLVQIEAVPIVLLRNNVTTNGSNNLADITSPVPGNKRMQGIESLSHAEQVL